MKINYIKSASIVAATALMASTMAGCGSSGPGDPTGSQASNAGSTTPSADGAVTISWYYPDDMNDHTKTVWDQINTYSKEKINTVVEYHPIPWGEYDDKVNTVMNSGQKFDIMFQSAKYFSMVAAGGAMPVEDLLQTVGKETWEYLPESLWTAATVNGHIYGVPTYKDNAACPGLIYNMDMAEDLGITMPKSFGGFAELDELFYELKEKRDAKYPEDKNIPLFKGFNTFNAVGENIADTFVLANIPGIESYKGKQPGEAFIPYETQECLDGYKLVRKWVEDGIYPMDATNYDTENSLRNSGKIFCDSPLGYVSFPENGWSDDVRTGFIPSDWRYMTTDYAMFGSNIIGAKSENPDRAIAFLNLVNTDNYVANTIRFGVEGDYYTKTDDGYLDFSNSLNADPANRAYYKWYGWQFGNLFAMSLPILEDPNLWKDLQKANEEAHVSENMGFVFDRSNIVNEMTACSAVKTEYDDNLKNGMLPDVEKSLDEYKAKLKASGIDKVLAEAQAQLTAWRKANGKSTIE